MRNHLLARSVLVALALTTSVAGCDLIQGKESAGDYGNDVAVNTKVKARLVDQLGLKSIGVDTLNNVVQLSGFVDSEQTKMRAGEIARNTEGVRDVKNNLIVR